MQLLKMFIKLLIHPPSFKASADPLAQGGRIAGGTMVARTEVPELCSIEIDFENKFMFCSCVVINENWILTALHCVYELVEKHIQRV